MSAADTARLIASLELGKDTLTPGMNRAEAGLAKLGLTTRATVALIGGSLAGAFGALSAGANESANAQAKFQAETGASAAEARAFGAAVNGLAGQSQQGFGDIATAMTAVRSEMGLTGDAGTKMTEAMLKFADATGIDATSAVKGLDGAMDAFSLTTDQATGLMDQLVLSHQKFGGSITENLDALTKMAPQLSALNISVDQGNGLLNAFAASGLDAAAGQKALNTAISNLPAGTDFGKLLDSIQAIPDPAARAARAIEVFGSKGGAAFANLKGPLSDYIITQGEAAGATKRSAEAIEGTFGAQFQRLMNQAGAAVRGFGSEFGPALTGVAALASGVGGLASALHLDDLFKGALDKAAGSGIVTAAASRVGLTIAAAIATSQAFAGTIAGGISTALTSAATSPVVLGAAARLGTISGGRFGTAFGIAAVVGIAAVAPDVTKAATKLGTDIHNSLAGIPGVKLFGDIIKAPLDFLNDAPWPIGKKGQPDWAGLGTDAGETLGKGMTVGVASSSHSLVQSVRDAFDLTLAAIRAKGPAIAAEAAKPFNQIPVDAGFALGLIPDLFDDLRRDLDRKSKEAGSVLIANWRTSWEGVARLEQGFFPEIVKTAGDIGKAAGTAMPHQMAVGISAARAEPLDAFNGLVESLKTPLSATKETARLIGELASKELAAGLVSGDPDIRNQARHVRDLILDRLEEIKPRAGTLSKDAMDAIAAGMKSKDAVIRAAALSIHQTVEAELALTDAKKWAQHAAEAYADGFESRQDYLAEKTRVFLAGAGHQMVATSPPKHGPLKDIAKWGHSTSRAWSDAFVGGLQPHRVTAALSQIGTGVRRRNQNAPEPARDPFLHEPGSDTFRATAQNRDVRAFDANRPRHIVTAFERFFGNLPAPKGGAWKFNPNAVLDPGQVEFVRGIEPIGKRSRTPDFGTRYHDYDPSERNFNFNIQASVSARDVVGGPSEHRRYGPTPHEAGSR